jgi:Carboxypeptidase regulatory-like domain
MRSLTHYAVSLTLVLSTAASLIAQTPATPKKGPGGTVTGKVTIKGKAAPGIVVGLRVSQPTTPYEATYKGTTDPDGKYRISDVPPGSYDLGPVAPALVIANSANPRGQTVVLTEGESVDGIDFALVRGGVITGKVTDADGRPVVEQVVSLISVDPQTNPRITTYPASSVQTDDRGVYRMFGLMAGRYKVAVGQGNESFFMGVSSGRPSYKQTFHPDTNDAARAAIVEVTEGSEAANVDIALGRASQTFAASGRVINGETSQPMANVRFGLQLVLGTQAGAFMGTTATSNSQGEFRLENLAPGKYAVFMLPQQDSSDRADAVAFEVIDQDVSELLIRTSAGATVTGTIVLENTDDKTALAKLLQLTVQGFVQGGGPTGNIAHAATINGDGSFVLKGLEAGSARLSLTSRTDRTLLKGFIIDRVERDGVVQTNGLEIKSGDQVTGVRVVVSYGNATVRGVVKVENGTLPADARLFVRVSKPGERVPSIRSPQVDGRGHFIMEGIPGGTYDFTVFMLGAPATGSRSPTAQQQVSVTDGVVNDVTITLDLNQKPGPPSP